MTNKNQTSAQKAAAQKKADEVAALMGEDSETAAVDKAAPPAIKPTTDDETEGQGGGETDGQDGGEKAEADKAEADKAEADKAAADKAEADKAAADKAAADKAAADKAAADKAAADKAAAEKLAAEKVGHMVVLSRTIHTKDKDGNDVKFIASKDPQDLGEYGDMAIKAGYAKEHKAV